MNKEIPLYGLEYINVDKLECQYNNLQKTGLQILIKCKNIASWEHPNNRLYCFKHHDLVNKINRKRNIEANKELKENINKYCFNETISENDSEWEKGYKTAMSNIIDKLNNGDFDE